jgi:hypothetical protein
MRTPAKLSSAVLVALMAVALWTGLAAASNRSYNGPAGSAPNSGVELGVKFNKKGHAVRVTRFEFHNVPATCQGYGNTAVTATYGKSMSVDSKRNFSGTRTINGGKLTIHIAGHLKSDFSKATGTLRAHGTVPGCGKADTGKVHWSAPQI